APPAPPALSSDAPDRARERGAGQHHQELAACAAEWHSHGPNADVRESGQSRAGARTGSDAGRSGAARLVNLVRRPRLRALATSLFADPERRRPALTSRSASAAIWPTDPWAYPGSAGG